MKSFVDRLNFYYHLINNEEKLYFLVFYELTLHQSIQSYIVLKFSRSLNKIEINIHKFHSDSLSHFIDLYFQFSNEQIFLIFSSFLIHFINLHFINYSSDISQFIINQFLHLISKEPSKIFKFVKLINQYLKEYETFLSGRFITHYHSYKIFPISI
jgi:hypothetical protein